MAVRTDITIDWQISPRIITIASPSTEIILQDLVDTLRVAEDELTNMDNPHLLNASGREDLGGGVEVGITAELQDAQLAFERRVTPLSSGTVTTADSGLKLIDGAATFISDGVTRGDLIYNHPDKSTTTVLIVDSETELTVLQPIGGTENDWDIGEAYDVYDVIQCNITGGNLVAVDSVGAGLDPVFPTFGTQVVRASSSSATTQNQSSLEHTSFDGGVTYDPDNVSGMSVTGTDFPIGTPLEPSNNITDTIAIAVARGFKTLKILGDPTIDGTESLDGYKLTGVNRAQTEITFSSADTGDITIQDASFSGSMNGGLFAKDCTIGAVTGVGCTTNRTTFENCLLTGNIQIRSDNTRNITFLNCGSATGSLIELDYNGTVGNLSIFGYHDRMVLKNITSAISVHVTGHGVELTIDSTCTAGNIEIHGNVNIINNGSMTLDDDTTQALVWTSSAASITAGSFGEIVANLIKYQTNKSIVNDVAFTLTIYDDDGITPITVFDLKDESGVASVTNIFQRIPQ